MKIKAIALSILMGAAAANAQIAPTPAPQTPGASESAQSASGDFKPESGNVTLELNMSPFSASPISLNYIRARLFLSDDLALRAGFSVGMNSSADVQSDDGSRTETDNSSFSWAVLPGIEKHFGGTERLSPYIGGEIVVAGQSASKEVVTTYTDTNIPGTTKTFKGSNDGNNGYFSFGVNVVAGCDFYFAKRIYMGLEAGFGLTTTSLADMVDTTIVGTSSESKTTERGSTMQLGPNFNSAIRIGFVF